MGNFKPAFAAIFAALTAVVPSNGDGLAPKEPVPTVSLRVAYVLEELPLTLAFTLTNLGDEAIPEPYLDVNDNAIYILTPSGHIGAGPTIADPVIGGGAKEGNPVAPRKQIAPNESKSFIVHFDRLAATIGLKLDDPGIYRIYWEYRGGKSRELSLLRRRPKPAGDGKREAPADLPDGQPRPGENRDHAAVKRVLRTFYVAMSRGERPTMLETLYADDESSWAAVRELAELTEAAWSLRRAMKEKFGDAVPADWEADEGLDDALEYVEAAQVTYPEYFETAVADLGFPCLLVRRGGNWRIAASNFVFEGKPYPQIREQAEAMNKTARQVMDGKFKTFAQANGALQRAVNKWDEKMPKVGRNAERTRGKD